MKTIYKILFSTILLLSLIGMSFGADLLIKGLTHREVYVDNLVPIEEVGII